jgi:hypothetical protein
MAIRKPGKKSQLPPRMPAFIKLPMIGQETVRSKERRAAAKRAGRREPKRELRYTEFATTEVLRTIEESCLQANNLAPSQASPTEITVLERGATESEVDFEIRQIDALCRNHDERAIFEDVALRIDLDSQMREVIRDFLIAKRCAADPKEFRRRLKRFETVLNKFVATLPTAEDDVTEALNNELYGSDDDCSPDVQQFREHSKAMLKAVTHLREQEAGAGRDADRAKHQLAAGLAQIFERHTGLRAGSGFWIARDRVGDDAVCGPFAEFFKAVNDIIEDISPGDHVCGLEALIRPLT